MITKEEWSMIRQLKNQGLTISEISRKLNIDRKTVRSALKTESIPKYERVPVSSIIDSFKNYIDSRLELYNLTTTKVLTELKNQGYEGGYGILNKYVQSKKGDLRSKAVMRFETLPGEQSQVDWGYFGEFYDQEKKKVIKLCCFLMVLGFSRMRFIHFFEKDDTEHFLMGHNLAFQSFGGYTKEILYDNLKSVVIKRAFKQKDSEFNKRFTEYSGFYGFKPILARPYRPQTKGKVENTVHYVRTNFFAGEEFVSLNDINNKAREWLNRVNNQIHGATHEKPTERLKRENLISFIKTYDLSKVFYRKVQNDCHFSFRGNFYSSPPELVGKEISIKLHEDQNHILLYYRNENVGIHSIEHCFKGGYITSPSHYLAIKKIMESQRANFWKGKSKEKTNNKSKNQEPESVRTASFDSRQVLQFYEEVEQRDLNIYSEAM